MKVEKNIRNSSLDLLKIISILFILILHYMNGSIGGGLSSSYDFYGIISHLIESFAIVGVNLFVLISSYYLIDKKTIKIRKIIDILIILLFYGILIYLVYLVFNPIDIKNLKIFFHTIFSRWFIYIYIIFYLLIPYLNKFLKNLTKKQLEYLILIMLFFFSIYPTFLTNVTVSDSGYGIINFILLFFIIGYYKEYKVLLNINKYIYLIIYILFTILTTIFSFFANRAWSYNSIFVIISSVSLFLFFCKLKIKSSSKLQIISSYSLPIYIIHENAFISKKIYQGIFKTLKYKTSPLLIPHLFFTCICIFIGCVIIELIRRKLFTPLINKLLLKIPFFNKEFTIN